ncbi:A-kinase anchor protein 17A [Saguinus oedipus]|uniref:A-kinase anchor protein 17A n=1 Tax=Saguinus oedipus TaxID=9490 RepID=A0ABQ9TDA1_SAGOE|nr:A-kinase anchor protein 17A [Saguinus oedipus]
MDRPDLARRRCLHPGAGVQPRGCPCTPDHGACKHLRSSSPGVRRTPDRGSAALSSSLQAVKLQEQERKEEKLRLQQQEERRRLQEAELRRVEEEKERALGLQRKERELRERLLSILLSKKPDDTHAHDELLQPVLDILHTVSSGCVGPATLHPLAGQPPAGAHREAPAPAEAVSAPKSVNGSVAEDAPGNEGQSACRVAPEDGSPEKRCPGVLSCIPDNSQQPKGLPACEQNVSKKDSRSEQDKCNREPSKGRGRAGGDALDERHKRDRSRARRATSREDGKPRKERRTHKKHAHKDGSPRRRSGSANHARSRRSHSKDRHRRERSRERRGSASRKRNRHRRRSERSRSRSPSRHRSAWNRSSSSTPAAPPPPPLSVHPCKAKTLLQPPMSKEPAGKKDDANPERSSSSAAARLALRFHTLALQDSIR